MSAVPLFPDLRVCMCLVATLFGDCRTPLWAQNDSTHRATRSSIVIDVTRQGKTVAPGAVGWGAMWKRSTLWPTPPEKLTDRTHAAYIRRLAADNKPLIREADVRHISWPWGVGFSTFGVNWENSALPWSQRKADCVRGSGWCEKAIVGVGDLLTLAAAWDLEAVTVSVPLAVFDGNSKRWGPRFFHDDFTDETIQKVTRHARQLIDFMKKQRGWRTLDRVYLAAGCEWRKYRLRNPSSAVLTYAKLIRSLREEIDEEKVWIVASASDSADIPGEAAKAASWNRYLYEQLHHTDRVVLDLHRYRGMIGATSASGKMPLTPENVDRLMSVGVSQRGYLAVDPSQWGERGKPMPSVLLENAIHGHDADHTKDAKGPAPWPVVMAHADLVREALASPAETFLGWTWFPENIPPEWPHGAVRNGSLSDHARAQGFLTKYYRGRLLTIRATNESSIRANAALQGQTVCVFGGNFSRFPSTLSLRISGAASKDGQLELMSERGVTSREWDGSNPVELGPATLFRLKAALE